MKKLLTALKDNAKLNVVGGITLALLGMLCISLPFVSGLTFAGIVSVAMVAYGMTITGFSFTQDKVWKGVLSFIGGILVSLFGILMFQNPVEHLYALAIIAVSYFIIDGIMSFVTTYKMRKTKAWGWPLFSGVISITLAALLISQWPLSSFYIIGTLIGVRFMISGFQIVLLASTGYSVVDEVEEVRDEVIKQQAPVNNVGEAKLA